MLISMWGFPLSLATAIVDFSFGMSRVGMWTLLISLGCLATFASSRRKDPSKHLIWWPAYFCFWVVSFPLLYYTGGASSPFFGEYLTLMFLTGILIQVSISPLKIAIFAAANFAFWGIQGALQPMALPDLPHGFVYVKTGGFIVGIFICIIALLHAEQELAAEGEVRQKQLNDTRGELAHSARLAEIGELVATTAHELAQPVQVICTVSSLLRRIIDKGGEPDPTITQPLLQRMSESADRLVRLLNQLRNFARKESFTPIMLDLRDAIRSVELLCRYDLRTKKVGFRVTLPDSPVWVKGDSLRLQQILLNLVNNARDAVSDSEAGSVGVEIQQTERWSRMIVTNSGSAIPLDVQAKLFKPYFTTKEQGKGTGLGLRICNQLVQQHGGRILFSSEEGETRFVVDLPRPGEENAGLPGLRTSLADDPVSREATQRLRTPTT